MIINAHKNAHFWKVKDEDTVYTRGQEDRTKQDIDKQEDSGHFMLYFPFSI